MGKNVKMSTALKREAHFRGLRGGQKLTKNDPKPKIGHIIFERRSWIAAWGHFGRFGASKVTPKWDKNDVENETDKIMLEN